MLYTVIYKKKLIIEADCSDEAEELAENGDSIIEEQELFAIRPTTQSERIWYDLPLKKENDYDEVFEDTSFPNKYCPQYGARTKGGE